jgi:predicted nucleotidyltransferase
LTPLLIENREAIAAICRRHGVRRLDVFGSSLDAAAFDPEESDIDVLVQFDGEVASDAFLDLKEALEAVFQRPVDLVEREAVQNSRNPIRRRRILADAAPLYAA